MKLLHKLTRDCEKLIKNLLEVVSKEYLFRHYKVQCLQRYFSCAEDGIELTVALIDDFIDSSGHDDRSASHCL